MTNIVYIISKSSKKFKLLFSGPIGGASGALGMGLFDLMN